MKKQHMDRRHKCPTCGCADIIRHRDEDFREVDYTCPKCKEHLRTEMPNEAA